MTEQAFALTAITRWAAELRFEDIPTGVVEQAELCVLDLVGVVVSAAADPDVRAMAAAQCELGGAGEASVFLSGERLSIAAAAQVNAFAASLPELADNVAVHTNEATIPLALAFGQVHGSSGRDVIAAVVAGDEVAKRLHDSYFFAKLEPPEFPIGNASVLGTVGSAVTAARLLGLDARGVFDAVGIALNLIASALDVSVMSGSPLKPFLFSGTAVQSGWTAAVLAKHGLAAAPDSFENARAGWLRFAAREWDLDELTRDLGERWVLQRPDRKRHASCGFSHAPLDGVLELLSQGSAVTADEIEKVSVRLFPFAYQTTIGSPEGPRTPTAAKFDLPYLIASLLGTSDIIRVPDTSVGVIEDRLGDPSVRALMRRVETQPDDSIGLENRFSADVTMSLKDGSTRHVWVEDARGKGGNQLSREELVDKYDSLAVPVLGAERATQVRETIDRLRALDDVSELVELLAR